MATQKITFGRRNTISPEERASAVNGADPSNNYMWGQQTAFRNFEEMTAASRSPKYGNPNVLPMSGMPQRDSNDNQVVSDPSRQTGLLGEFSSTQSPQQSPEIMAEAAEERIQNMANGRQFTGYNDRQQIYGA